jgi:hypothetical protein
MVGIVGKHTRKACEMAVCKKHKVLARRKTNGKSLWTDSWQKRVVKRWEIVKQEESEKESWVF